MFLHLRGFLTVISVGSAFYLTKMLSLFTCIYMSFLLTLLKGKNSLNDVSSFLHGTFSSHSASFMVQCCSAQQLLKIMGSGVTLATSWTDQRHPATSDGKQDDAPCPHSTYRR